MGFSIIVGGAIFGSVMNSVAADREGDTIEQQSAFKRWAYDANSRLANIQAQDSIERGETAVKQVRRGTRKAIGTSRAALAAQGVDVNSGSAADLLEQAEYYGEMDALTVRNNAWMESFGYRSQAVQMGAQGIFSTLAGQNAKKQTALVGNINSANILTKGLKDATDDSAYADVASSTG